MRFCAIADAKVNDRGRNRSMKPETPPKPGGVFILQDRFGNPVRLSGLS